jgi:SRSO17 transposase
VALCGEVFAGSLGRRDQHAKAAAYVKGLLGEGRKSMEQIGWETLGEQWQGIQNFISDCEWDANPAWDAISARLAATIEPDVIVIDEEGDPKSGYDSVGVARQRCGRLGKVESCQVVVSVHMSGLRGSGMVGSQLLMPEEWTCDPARRAKARVPAALVHETPVQIATRLLAHQRSLGYGYLVALGDIAYGRSSDLRMSLEADAQPYVMQVQSDTRVRPANEHVRHLPPQTSKGARRVSDWEYARAPVSVRKLARRHRAEFEDVNWENPDVTTPHAGKHTSRFAAIPVRPAMEQYEDAYAKQGVDTPLNTLLIEWPNGNKDAVRYWLCSMPPDTTLGRLVELAKRRYRVEQDYHELKGEMGLDKFQGRLYNGFAHHVVGCAAAQLFLALERVSRHWREAWREYVGPRCSYSIATVRRFVHKALTTLGTPSAGGGSATNGGFATSAHSRAGPPPHSAAQIA